ncbi:hypothetical protein AMJ86_07875 [bacterium SM23_57]|nr:MAG: hypothetical protein AMJ86_07875 [bacterium SM23_57]
MTKVIILPEENLDRYYDRTIERFRVKYHSRPSALSNSRSNKHQFKSNTPSSSFNYSQSHIPLGKLIG